MATKKLARTARSGGVRRLKSGRYQARCTRDGMTHTAPDTFATEADAWDYLTTVEASMITGTWRAPRRATPTPADSGSRWIRTNPRVRDTPRADPEPA